MEVSFLMKIKRERLFMPIYDGSVDKGLEGVVACTTAISSIVNATLCYRGYTIEDLVENSNFEEVVFLLWNDRLPGLSNSKSSNPLWAETWLWNLILLRLLKDFRQSPPHGLASGGCFHDGTLG